MLGKLIVGRYFEFTSPPPIPLPANANTPAGFVTLGNAAAFHLAETHSSATPQPKLNLMAGMTLGQKAAVLQQRGGNFVSGQLDRQTVSKATFGLSGDGNRDFRWLEWMLGQVSEMRSNNSDVLTGFMSGCWITSYQRMGTWYVGHVGTDMLQNTVNSVAARLAWNNFANGGAGANVQGFNPFNDPWVGAPPVAQPGEGSIKTLALVTGARTFHTVKVFNSVAKPSRFRIAGIQQNPPTLPATI
jgi:hypothetical protein